MKRATFVGAGVFFLTLAQGEDSGAQALIRGTLLDEGTNQPVSAGVVTLLNDRLRIVTTDESEADGSFELRVGRTGDYTMRSQRLGYLNTSTPSVTLVEGDTIHVEFRISPDVIYLAPITITATARRWWETSQPAVLWSFFERREEYERMGMGRFLDRDDLELYDGMPLWQMLGTIPGVRIHQTEDGGVTYPSLRGQRGLLRACQPEYFVDGMAIRMRSPDNPDFGPSDTIDSVLTVSQIVGMEVYAGAAQVPGVYGGTSANCGVIAFWTTRQN